MSPKTKSAAVETPPDQVDPEFATFAFHKVKADVAPTTEEDSTTEASSKPEMIDKVHLEVKSEDFPT